MEEVKLVLNDKGDGAFYLSEGEEQIGLQVIMLKTAKEVIELAQKRSVIRSIKSEK